MYCATSAMDLLQSQYLLSGMFLFVKSENPALDNFLRCAKICSVLA